MKSPIFILVLSLLLMSQASWLRKAEAQEANLVSFDTVSDWIETGQYTLALEALEQHIKAGNPKAQAYFLQGIAHLQQGSLADAAAAFSNMTKFFPQLPEGFINLAAVYAEQSAYENARQTLLKAIDLAPDLAIAYINLGDLYVLMAEQAYRQANRLDRNNSYSATRAELLQTLNAH